MALTEDGLTALVPLRTTGGRVLAYAKIDPADEPLINRWRWQLSQGYATRSDMNRKAVRMHRVILGLTTGDGLEGDHRNLDKLDNRRANLRAVPAMSANRQNRPSNPGSSSQYRGVTWDRKAGQWRVIVVVNGHRFGFGQFKVESEAGEMARSVRRRLMPYAVD